jgi:hypothetical protein
MNWQQWLDVGQWTVIFFLIYKGAMNEVRIDRLEDK